MPVIVAAFLKEIPVHANCRAFFSESANFNIKKFWRLQITHYLRRGFGENKSREPTSPPQTVPPHPAPASLKRKKHCAGQDREPMSKHTLILTLNLTHSFTVPVFIGS